MIIAGDHQPFQGTGPALLKRPGHGGTGFAHTNDDIAAGNGRRQMVAYDRRGQCGRDGGIEKLFEQLNRFGTCHPTSQNIQPQSRSFRPALFAG